MNDYILPDNLPVILQPNMTNGIFQTFKTYFLELEMILIYTEQFNIS